MNGDCTTCAKHKHLKTIDVHICKLAGPLDEDDVHKTGCPEWEPKEAAA